MEERVIEQIGKINLDLTHYPGEDFYCDGAIEDELLRITRDYSRVEYARIIEESHNWEILYHLSAQRENIVEWLPIKKDMKVLEVGSGCGAITGALARKAGSVTCIDLSKKRSMINAYRHMDCDNVTIHVGNFQDVEPDLPQDYDYICLIGVFEYGQAYIGSDRPYEGFLEILKKHMKKNGHIAIAIENKFGLKYWAGCKEDHLGTYFSGLEGYPDGGVVRTFTRYGLEQIFSSCGVENYSFYYPYPDYKFMTSIYSDDYMPKPGELSNNIRNFDRDRMVLFDEKKVFDSILRDGLFPLYSNSYMVIIGDELDIKYVKYSNDRQPEYQIKTEIVLQNYLSNAGDGKNLAENDIKRFVVRKHPLSIEANEHIRNVEVAFEKLKERYTGGELRINRCMLVDVGTQLKDGITETELMQGKREIQNIRPYVELEYINGVTLSELMDQALTMDDMDQFMRLFDRYIEILDYHNEMPVADFDLIFSNILISQKDFQKAFDPLDNAVWTLIDYEWTFGKQIDTKELAFRAVYCYILEDSKRNKLKLDLIMDRLEISDKDAEEYRGQELSFQRFVTGNRRSMTEIRDLIGHKCYEPEKWIDKMRTAEQKGRIQIYPDKGNGLCEEESFFMDQGIGDFYEDESGIHLTVPVESGTRLVRIDPAFSRCIVHIKELSFNQTPLDRAGKTSVLTSNGVCLDDSDTYVFNTEDPNFNISLEGLPFDEVNFLEISFEISFLTADMAENIEKSAKKRFRL